jgi:hypothetical protein
MAIEDSILSLPSAPKKTQRERAMAKFKAQ